MAAHVSHVVYADKALNTILKGRKIDQKQYFLGTLFPDIRYQANIKREATHRLISSVDQLKYIKSDFELGMLVHSFVDHEHIMALIKVCNDNHIELNSVSLTFLKYFADHYCYRYYHHWSKVIKFLETPTESEFELVKPKLVYWWHNVLKDYLIAEPTIDTVLNHLENIGIKNMALNFLAMHPKLLKDKKLITDLKDIYFHIFNDYASRA